MFALLLIKFNQLAIRTRLMAGLSVGLIFIIILAASYYRIFLFDNLARYGSKNTEIYLHLDNRGVSDNFYKIKVTDAILKSFHINDLDRHLIGSELAIICDDYAAELDCGLIIQAKKPETLEKYLADKQIVFRSMNKNTIIIGADASWLKVIKKSYNPFRYLESQSAYGKFGAMTLILNQPAKMQNEIAKILHLSDLKNGIKLNGAITGRGIIFKSFGLAAPFSSIKSSLTDGLSDPVCDIMINSNRGYQSKILSGYILQLFAGNYASALPNLTGKQFNLCMDKTASSGNLIKDYDITIESSSKLDAAGIIALDKLLLNLAARSQPTAKTSYLNDGTKISELFAKPENFSFESASGTKSIKINDSISINYSNSEAGLAVSNKIGIKTSGSDKLPDNHISIRINVLPKGQIKDILSEFSYLVATDNQILLK